MSVCMGNSSAHILPRKTYVNCVVSVILVQSKVGTNIEKMFMFFKSENNVAMLFQI